MPTPLPASPFVAPEPDGNRFVLDEERFLADIEEPPLFLRAPASMTAVELMPIVEVLKAY